MDLDHYFDTIEAYIDNTLSADDRKAFEKELEDNEVLKTEVLKHILAKEVVGIALEDKIRANLEKVKTADASPSADLSEGKSKVRRLFRPLSVAAGILLLVVAGWVFFQFSSHSNDALADSYYQEASTGTLMGAGSSDATIEAGQTALFREKDPEKALTIFSKIDQTDTNYTAAQYYSGHAYFMKNEFERSADAFEVVYITVDLPSFIDREEVRWNWMLAKLGAGADEEALNTLDQILKNEDGAYYEKASGLIDQLNSIWR